jgi:hypothetical protein
MVCLTGFFGGFFKFVLVLGCFIVVVLSCEDCFECDVTMCAFICLRFADRFVPERCFVKLMSAGFSLICFVFQASDFSAGRRLNRVQFQFPSPCPRATVKGSCVCVCFVGSGCRCYSG